MKQPLKIDFFRMGLDDPHIQASFGGMYRSFFHALERLGHVVSFSMDAPNQNADVLVAPVGDQQDRNSARAMSAFDGPVILHVGAAKYWRRKDFLARWAEKIIFVFGTDVSPYATSAFAECGIAYKGLPFASDPSVMLPLHQTKIYDIVMVGNAVSGSGRYEYVERLFQFIDKRKALFIGPGWERYGFPFQMVAWGELLNLVYNCSEICLNIINDQQNPEQLLFANNRLFDLAMAGCLQISNAPGTVRKYFSAGEVPAYETPADWADAVRYYLAHPEEASPIRKAAQARALRDHTWDPRAENFAEWIRDALSVWTPGKNAAPRLRRIARARDTVLPPYGMKEFMTKAGRKISHTFGGK